MTFLTFTLHSILIAAGKYHFVTYCQLAFNIIICHWDKWRLDQLSRYRNLLWAGWMGVRIPVGGVIFSGSDRLVRSTHPPVQSVSVLLLMSKGSGLWH
jgi:hypothetical protein